MREIKFRAWDKDRSQWIHPEEFKMNGTGKPVWTLLDTQEIELQQFTGLHDKNGKEIYEGDILEFEEPMFESGIIRQPVRFHEGGFEAGEYAFNEYLIAERGEVIGNIYKNLELIEKKQMKEDIDREIMLVVGISILANIIMFIVMLIQHGLVCWSC